MGRPNDTVLTLEKQGLIGAALSTATASAGATSGSATLNTSSGKVTTDTATGAAGAIYTLTLTNSVIEATDIVLCSVAGGGTGQPGVSTVTPAAGSCTIVIENLGGSAFNAALVISFFVVKVV